MPVIAVVEDQDLDLAGILHDYYHITFTIEGRPGSFEVRVPKDGDPVAAAQAAISAEASTVQALYGL